MLLAAGWSLFVVCLWLVMFVAGCPLYLFDGCSLLVVVCGFGVFVD